MRCTGATSPRKASFRQRAPQSKWRDCRRMHWLKSKSLPGGNDSGGAPSNGVRNGGKMAEAKVEKIEKTDAEWRAQLTPEQYYITRQKGTEPAFSGALYHNHDAGTYHCVACGAELFKSDTKFDSGSGWPSFWLPADQSAIETHEDTSYGMRRIEVTCARCGS